MGPAGLAVGIAGLASLFGACVDAYNRIDGYRKYGFESEQVISRLEVQKTLFERWAKAAGVAGERLSPDHHISLDDAGTIELVMNTVKIIRKLLLSISESFGLPLPKSSIAAAPLSRRNEGEILQDRVPPSRPKSSLRREVKWALGKKEFLLNQLESLEKMVENLAVLVPVEPFAALPRDAHAGVAHTGWSEQFAEESEIIMTKILSKVPYGVFSS